MKKYFAVITTLIATFVFYGCDNFMEGTDLRNRIDAEIELANAPLVSVNFEEGKGGNIDPRGKRDIKLKQEFSLSYLRDEDYQFTQWQVFLNGTLLTENESEYVEFENKEDTTTQVKILQNVTGLKIKPLCYERPVVLSRTPVETSGGSYRDARVIVNFSQPMDESSIYYASEAEVPDHDSNGLLEVTVKGEKRIYGYKKNGVHYFKNVDIINLNTQENLLSHYKDPIFETPTRLSISTIKGNEPPKGVQILVSVSKNMCARESKAILKTSEVWNYFCNNRTDTESPVISSISLSNKKIGSDAYTPLPEEAISKTKVSANEVKDYHLKNNTLGMIIEVTDGDSGVDKAYIKYKRLYDAEYNKLSTPEEEKENSLTLSFMGNKNNAYVYEDEGIPAEFQFNESDPDGIYEVYFEFKDVNGNSTNSDKKYYVLKDNTGPECTYTFTSDKNAVTLTNTSGNSSDVAKVNLTYKNLTETSKDQNISKNYTYSGDSFTVSGLNNTNVSFYEMKIEAEDIFGNKASKTINVVTKPDAPVISEANFIKKYTAGEAKTDIYKEFDKLYRTKDKPERNFFKTVYSRKASNVTPLPKLPQASSIKYFLYDSSNSIIKECDDADSIVIPMKDVRGRDTYYLSIVINYNGTNIESSKTKFEYNEYRLEEFYMMGGFATNNSNVVEMRFTLGFSNYNKVYSIPWEKCRTRDFNPNENTGKISSSDIKDYRVGYDFTRTPGYNFRYTLKDDYDKIRGQIIFTQQSDESDPNIVFLPGEN